MDTKEGLGLSWLWMLSPSHPFNGCAIQHDRWYETIKPGQSTLAGDRAFKGCCLSLLSMLAGLNPVDLWDVINRGESDEARKKFCALRQWRQALWAYLTIRKLELEVDVFYALCRARGLVFEKLKR